MNIRGYNKVGTLRSSGTGTLMSDREERSERYGSVEGTGSRGNERVRRCSWLTSMGCGITTC